MTKFTDSYIKGVKEGATVVGVVVGTFGVFAAFIVGAMWPMLVGFYIGYNHAPDSALLLLGTLVAQALYIVFIAAPLNNHFDLTGKLEGWFDNDEE